MFPKLLVYAVLPAAFVILGDSLIYLILPLQPEEFGMTDFWGIELGLWIGIALSINRFIRIFTNSLAANCYLKFGFKYPFMISILIGALTTISYGISNHIIILLIARIFWGVSFSFHKLGTQLAVFEFGSDFNTGRLLGFANASVRAGSLLAVIIGAFFIQNFNIQVTFFAFGITGLIIMFIITLIPNFLVKELPDKKSGVKRINNHKRNFLLAFIVGVNSGKIGHRKVEVKLLSASFLRFSSAFSSNGMMIATASLFVSKVLINDPVLLGFQVNIITLAGIVIAIRWVADLFLSVPLGEISDRKGRNFIANICTLLMIFGSILLIFSGSNAELMLLSFILLFFSSVGANVSLEAIVGRLAGPTNRPLALSRFNTWADLGAALGPLIGFFMLGFSSFQMIYLVSASILLISWIIFLTVFIMSTNQIAKLPGKSTF